MRRMLFVGYALAGVAWLILWPFLGHAGTAYDSWYQAFSVLSMAGIALGIYLNRPVSAAPWWLIAAGQGLFGAGDAAYLVYEDLHGGTFGYPGLPDFFYLAGYPLIAAGLLLMIRRSTPGRDWASLLDAAIVTIGAAIVSWEFLIEPYTLSTEALSQRAVSIAYPMMDVLLLAVAARMLLSGGRRTPSYRWLVGAILLQLVGDVFYGVGQLKGVYTSWSDLPLAAAYLVWGLSALHPSMAGLTAPKSDPEGALTRRRLALLVSASLLGPGMIAVDSFRSDSAGVLPAVVGSVLLYVLVIVRLAGFVARHERSIRREHTLRQSASELAAAPDREAIYEIALRAVGELTQPRRAHAELTMEKKDGKAEVVAATELAETADRESVENHAFPLLVQGEARGAIAVWGDCPPSTVWRDSIQTLAAQVALALESVERFRSLVENSTDLIVVMEADLTIRFATPSIRTVLGYEEDELVGRRLTELLAEDELRGARDLFEHLSTGARAPAKAQFRLRRKDGSWCDTESVSTNLLLDPTVRGLVFTARDVTEQKQLEQQLVHQAFHDPLTGLANRALFRDRLEHALDRRFAEKQQIAVVFVDIDDFKSVNDSRGHTAGDELLVAVAKRLGESVRPADTCARFGGDEFAILAEGNRSVEEVTEIAQRILRALTGSPIRLAGGEIRLKASAGVTVYEPGESTSDLLRNADIALHEAKRLGKNRYQLFERRMRERILERAEMHEDFRRALEQGELEVYYQPIVELASGSIVAFEALTRWQHPDLGFVPPDRFIPLAEDFGLIQPLGRFVLHEACRTTQRWRETIPGAEALRVNVNVSAQQLVSDVVQQDVRDAITESRLPPSGLILEITESVLMTSRGEAVARLDGLRKLGIQVALDDFGTGYSSLEYLQNLPIDMLKIAQPFVANLSDASDRPRVTEAILSLSATLGVQTIAEGIEEVEQLEELRALGCNLGQGFYFSQPLPADAAEVLLRSSVAAKRRERSHAA